MHGAGGDDYIIGGANSDNLYGDEGNDTIYGGGSADKLRGGEGNDYLNGGGGADRIYGGSGDDIIFGGAGDDVLYGDNPNDPTETGADIFEFDKDDGSDKVFDFELGLDKVRLLEGNTYSLSYLGDNTILTYGTTTVRFYDAHLTSADIIFA
ncbi:calcium-binding protein [Novosphingobium sp. ST904]|uniref:calcium-binding protein n=1 Tax=Novosphingobium sp. ST904 TaxID=1684385 RepID=UPI000AA07E6F|nr:calcium-binding protein [Novosphingobium sp. ST904]